MFGFCRLFLKSNVCRLAVECRGERKGQGHGGKGVVGSVREGT